MHDVHVACPCCKNKRLFDADPDDVEGVIKIKCPVCRSVIAVSFHLKHVRTEQIGT
jgi:predicted  nucleic acid-binding Zn ribbon protein